MLNCFVVAFCFGCLMVVVLIAVWLLACVVGFWLCWSPAITLVDCWLGSFLFVGLVCWWLLAVCSCDWEIVGSWLDSTLVSGLVGCWLLAWLFGIC